MQFVDTNIFIRHLTGDDPKKAQACLELFQKAQRNELQLTTSEAIIAEVVYVLSSAKQLYTLAPAQIRDRLYPLLSIPNLKLLHRKTYLRALDLYAANPVDFEDALAIAQIERQKLSELFSYDRGFDRFAQVKRLEPSSAAAKD